jgi:hypothetical protein
MGAMTGQIDTRCSLQAFFEDLMRDALAEERVVLDPAAVAYLVQLCSEFSRHESLHGRARPDEPGTPTLAWLLQQAREGAPSARFDAYRHLGDVSLVVSGFFGPHLERRRALVGVDYHVEMGAAAYDHAASLARTSGFGGLLAELAAKFRRVVEVLTRMAERTTLPVCRDLGALYARVLRFPESRVLQARLIEQHALPVLARGARG